MADELDIAALRSLTAIADSGGYHRAASALRISQSAVSHHVRRLELAVGKCLLARDGRTMRFTPDGETLLADARSIVTLHDDALMRLGVGRAGARTVTVGATEHAADHLLPYVNRALSERLPDARITFRLDRGGRLAESMERGVVDVCLLFGSAGSGEHRAGELPLSWFAATGWVAPAPGESVPLVVIDEPCTIRRQALGTLAAAGREARIVGEAGHLAGVLNAARAGLGVALLADVGPVPSGLARVAELPPVGTQPLLVRAKAGAAEDLGPLVSAAVRRALSTAAGAVTPPSG